MDPASVVLGVVSGAAAIAALTLKITTYLVGVKDTFRDAQTNLEELVSHCKAFEAAWASIRDWVQGSTAGSEESATIYLQLLSYLDSSKNVLQGLQNDLQRLNAGDRSSWRIVNRYSKAKTVLHEKLLSTHCDRLHRQITLLHLLLSTAKLPCVHQQNVVVELLQPVFRKDEESAWTIVQSKRSTRLAASSFVSESPLVNTQEINEARDRQYSFENDLVLAPVYKRVLFRSLRSPYTMKEANHSNTSFISLARNLAQNAARDVTIIREESTLVHLPAPTHNMVIADLSPSSIRIALRQAGGISLGVQADLDELRRTADTNDLPKRSLPLHSVLKQAELDTSGQNIINQSLLLGAQTGDLNLVAKTLDDGADINAVGSGGRSVLQHSVYHNHWKVVMLLLLYKETRKTFPADSSNSIMHLAAKARAMGVLRLLIDSADDLKVYNGEGQSLLHLVTIQARREGLVEDFYRMLCSKRIDPHSILDLRGRSVLQAAADRNDTTCGFRLARLFVCDAKYKLLNRFPFSVDLDIKSSLSTAINSDHIDFVRAVLDALSESTDEGDKTTSSKYLKYVSSVAVEQRKLYILEFFLSRGLQLSAELGLLDDEVLVDLRRTPILFLQTLALQSLGPHIDLAPSLPRLTILFTQSFDFHQTPRTSPPWMEPFANVKPESKLNRARYLLQAAAQMATIGLREGYTPSVSYTISEFCGTNSKELVLTVGDLIVEIICSLLQLVPELHEPRRPIQQNQENLEVYDLQMIYYRSHPSGSNENNIWRSRLYYIWNERSKFVCYGNARDFLLALVSLEKRKTLDFHVMLYRSRKEDSNKMFSPAIPDNRTWFPYGSLSAISPKRSLMDQNMHIFVRNLKGENIRISARPSDSVWVVKNLIQYEEGIFPHDQQLLHDDMALQDHISIHEYGITKESNLHLVGYPNSGRVSQWRYTTVGVIASISSDLKGIISLKLRTGKEETWPDVSRHDSITSIKVRIEFSIGVPAEQQQLMSLGKVLADEMRLSDTTVYGLEQSLQVMLSS